MAQRGAAYPEDEELESKQSLHHKEAITAQMIGIISARLDSLQTTARNRKDGLECDLQVNSDYCSKMVPPHVDTLESRSIATAKTRSISSTVSPNNQAMLERLFGPDETARAHMQKIKMNKMEINRGENRRSARLRVEKQLQTNIEGHITRTVESFIYEIDHSGNQNRALKSNICMDTNLLLLHTFHRIRMHQGRRNLKKFLLSELSTTLFESVFWLVFCHFYQKNSLTQQHALVDEISSKYVLMVAALQARMDHLFRVYPYAIASGVCWGFHYLFPASRHLYTPEFKNDVFLFVCQVLLGFQMTPVSVHSMRRQYFPEEFVDDFGTKSKPVGKLAASASTGAIPDTGSAIAGNSSLSALYDTSHLPRLLSPETSPSLAKSASELSYLGKLAIGDNSIAKILESQTTQGGRNDKDEIRAVGCIRRYQKRAIFNATQMSPLMKQYFRSSTKNAKKPTFLMRTTPANGCVVGGEVTFHKFHEDKTQMSFAAKAQQQQEKCRREIQKDRRHTKRDIAALKEARDLALTSGRNALQAYCTMLMGRKQTSDNAADIAS